MEQDITGLRTWILHDGRTGHLNQSLGVAEAMGIENPTIHTLEKAPLHAFWRKVWPAKAWKIPASPYPELLIATGWQMSHISRFIKRINPRTFTVQMMRPSGDVADYDVVAMPVHDAPPARDNVVATVGTPNRVSEKRLKQEGERWESRLAECPSPRLAVLVGGPTKGFAFGMEQAKDLADKVIEQGKSKGYSLLVTVSRRTGADVTEYLRARFEKSGLPIYFWTGMDPMKRDNPFLAYLALAEAIIVTVESISMISESCTSGKPVYVWGLDKLNRKKFDMFLNILQEQKRIAPFTGEVTLRKPDYPLDDTRQVVGFVQGKLLKKGAATGRAA